MENAALRDARAVTHGAASASADVEIGDDGCAIAGGRARETRAGGRGGWLTAGACAAACGLGVALAMAGSRNGDETGGRGVIAREDIDVRRFVAVPMLGSKRGRRGTSSKRGDDDDDAPGLGIDGDDDVPPFAANTGYFAYEEWFKKFTHGKSPGESKRELAGAAAATPIQESAHRGVVDSDGWKTIRDDLRHAGGKRKLLLLLRHGQATHNAWGDTVDEELETLPCTWRDHGDLLDPSLTDRGVEQALTTRASLTTRDGFFKAIRGGSDKKDRIRVASSPLSRAMETAIIVTSGVDHISRPIAVTDYLRERIELNAPFEVRRPISIDEGEDSDASKSIKNSHAHGCKFHKGLRELYGDDAFMLNVETHHKHHSDCRVDKTTPLSYTHCGGLTLTHEADLELGDEREENIIAMMNRVKVVLANVFDRYDEEVVMLVTHSDFIISALMELYPDTLGFVPQNGEVVPIVVEDRRTNHLPEAHATDDDASETASKAKTKSKAAVGEADHNRKHAKSEDKETEDRTARGKKSMRAKASTGDEIVVDSDSSGPAATIKYFDDDDQTAKESATRHKSRKREASLGNDLSRRVEESLKNFHKQFERSADLGSE